MDDPGTIGTKPGLKATLLAGLRRLWPILVLITGFALFFALGLDERFTLDTLKENREWLQDRVSSHPVISLAVFMTSYALVVAFSLPGGAMMTVIGGFLFGVVAGSLYVVAAATIGATTVFLAARTALGDGLRRRAGPWLARLQDGFRENEMSYLLVLRLIPLFPFFVVNIVPAFLGVSLRTYIVATFFGIMPGTVVYALFGAGLGSVLDQGGELTLGGVLTPEIIAALVGLAVFALLPVFYKRYSRRRSQSV